ncbi:MAG TPA: CotH kinase family protein [Tepidisphaeraceae bacterium]|jgi:spore coat protein CotH|nr:CotH kinase family protein [Tepidisphaeraceae bacterium]
MKTVLRSLVIVLAFFISTKTASFAAEAAKPVPQKSSDLFTTTTVWNVHLRFTPEQFQAMEPLNDRGFFGLGGPRNPEQFGPAMFLSPIFLRQGDANGDGRISRQEFAEMGARWFEQWDKDKKGKLTQAQLRSALNSTFAGGGGVEMMKIRLQGDEGRRNGLASAMGVEFKYVHADMEFEDQRFKDVAVRYKGNGTWLNSRGMDKRSMKIDVNQFSKGQKLAGVATLNLHNNITDASWMNEVLSHRLYRDAGVPAARSAYARVYLTVPGKSDHKYLGLYSLIENIDKHFVQENVGGKKGALLKPVTPNLFAYLGNDWDKYNQIYDPKTELTPKQQKRIIEFCKLLDSADNSEFAAKIGEYLDIDEFSRYMAVTVWLSTLDSILAIGQNYYVYLDPGGKFQFLPWDLDHSFGQFPLIGTQEQRDKLSIHHPWRGENRFLERMFRVEEFKKLYLQRMEDFSKDIFQPERFIKQVDQIAAAIRPAVADESQQRLTRFDGVVAGKAVESSPMGVPPQRRGTTQPATQSTAQGRPGMFGPTLNPIKLFAPLRTRSVLEQLSGKSEGLTLENLAGPNGPPPNAFGPGFFLAPVVLKAFDTNQDQALSSEEFAAGFLRWFEAWNTDKSGLLTADQLRAGLNQDLSTTAPGPFARPGVNPPPPPRQ